MNYRYTSASTCAGNNKCPGIHLHLPEQVTTSVQLYLYEQVTTSVELYLPEQVTTSVQLYLPEQVAIGVSTCIWYTTYASGNCYFYLCLPEQVVFQSPSRMRRRDVLPHPLSPVTNTLVPRANCHVKSVTQTQQ